MSKRYGKRHLILVGLVCAALLLALGTRQTVTQSKKGWRGADVETALKRLGYTPEEALRLQRLTAYNATAPQTDADPATSSCGPTRKNQLALSRDLFFAPNGAKHLCGARAILLVVDPATGKVTDKYERVVWDTMDERFERTADLLLQSTAQAKTWGVKEGVLLLEQAVQAAN